MKPRQSRVPFQSRSLVSAGLKRTSGTGGPGGPQSPAPAQVFLDALALRSEALASRSGVARAVNGGLKAATGAKKAGDGNLYGAAASFASALDKLAPRLYQSPLGTAASAVVLVYGDGQLAAQREALSRSYRAAVDPGASGRTRAEAALDAVAGTSQLASIWRAMGKAVANLGRFALTTLGRLSRFEAVLGMAEEVIALVAASGLGRSLKFLNRWVPLLNVAWLVLSAKTALEVFHDGRSSRATKALSVVSVGLSGAVLASGVALGALPFYGIVGGSILVDVALTEARSRDQAGLR